MRNSDASDGCFRPLRDRENNLSIAKRASCARPTRPDHRPSGSWSQNCPSDPSDDTASTGLSNLHHRPVLHLVPPAP